MNNQHFGLLRHCSAQVAQCKQPTTNTSASRLLSLSKYSASNQQPTLRLTSALLSTSRSVQATNTTYKIGLTGGISTGKTMVSQYLDRVHHLPILDADIYAREAVDRDSPILAKIVRRYGPEILSPDRSLHRKKLGEIVFSQPQEKKWLEAQIHPYVRDRFVEELVALNATIAVLVIPLLFESDMMDFVNSVWVVSCSPEQQLQRLCDRDGLSPEQARSRINSQIPLTQKIAAADIVLDNSSTIKDLLHQVDATLKSLT